MHQLIHLYEGVYHPTIVYQDNFYLQLENISWAHDFYGYGPSSLGGFVPGKQSLSLGLNLDKGDGLRVGLSYVMQMGDLVDNMSEDRDFVSANVSYAF